jgi:hypothetical protein
MLFSSYLEFWTTVNAHKSSDSDTDGSFAAVLTYTAIEVK